LIGAWSPRVGVSKLLSFNNFVYTRVTQTCITRAKHDLYVEDEPVLKEPRKTPRKFGFFYNNTHFKHVNHRTNGVIPQYQYDTNQTAKRKLFDYYAVQMDYQRKYLHDNIFELLQQYNTEDVDIPGYSYRYPLEENMAYQVLTNMTEEDWENTSVGEIELAIGSMKSVIDLIANLDEIDARELHEMMMKYAAPHLMRAFADPTLLEDFELFPAYPDHPMEFPANQSFGGFVRNHKYIEELIEEYEIDDEEEFAILLDFLEFERYLQDQMDPNKTKIDAAMGRFRAGHMTTDQIDKMFELHKQDPKYFTGERLADMFGIKRDAAWAYLLMAEYDEALEKGLPFNPNKAYVLFPNYNRPSSKMHKNIARSAELRRKFLKEKLMTEDEIYKAYLEESSKPIDVSTTDDALPDWVKIPFYNPDGTAKPLTEEPKEESNQEKVTTQVPVKPYFDPEIPVMPNKSGLGNKTSRSRHFIVEMRRGRIDERKRIYFVLETDGKLRRMSEEERIYINRRGYLPKTTHGLGGKRKRKLLVRKREFDKTWHMDD
jgi:hypothetical protein